MGMISYGTIFQYDLDGVAPFTSFATVKKVGPPGWSVGESNETHLESTNATEEWGPGWGKTKEYPVTIAFSKSQLSTIDGLYRARRYFRHLYPLASGESTPSRFDSYGFIKDLQPSDMEADNDDELVYDLISKVSGKPAFTQGS